MAIGYTRNRRGQAPLAIARGNGYAGSMLDLIISLMMLAALLLTGGAIFLFRRGDRRRAVLMAVLAAVMAINVAIWLVPTESGDTLAGSVERG